MKLVFLKRIKLVRYVFDAVLIPASFAVHFYRSFFFDDLKEKGDLKKKMVVWGSVA